MAAVFTSGSAAADYGAVTPGDGAVTAGNPGTGYVGASLRYSLTATSNEQSVRKALPAACRIVQMWVKVDPAATLSTTTDASILRVFSDAAFTTALIDVRIIGVTGGFTVRTVDPNAGYATTVGSTVLTSGRWHRITFSMTDTAARVWLDQSATADLTYTPTTPFGATLAANSIALGKWYTTGYVGILDIDSVWCGNSDAAPTTPAQQVSDVYAGWVQRYVQPDGAVVRPPEEGANLTNAAAPDVVSEGLAYGLKLAVQQGDQATFRLIDNWTIGNILRSLSTTANTSTNAAPTTALHLMGFHWNPSNADGKGPGTFYDAAWASDADLDRAQALLWAHARWGSSANTVGTTSELATPNYLQRAMDVIGDLRQYAIRQSAATGYWYLMSDPFQSGDTVQLAPDYNGVAAYRLIGQYDSANAAVWNGLAAGAYDLVTKAANQIFSGQTTTAKLDTNWVQFTLSTGVTSATPSTYGDSNYGYNAFRISQRSYEDYVWNGRSDALAALQLPKAFFTNEWAKGSIAATYYHDGSHPATYSNSYLYWPAYFSLYSGDTGNTSASAILSGPLSGLYVQSPIGSFFSDASATTPQYSYFGASWGLIGRRQQAGLWVNYGQTTAASASGSVTLTGAATAAPQASAAGGLTLSGAPSAGSQATAAGGVTLSGTATPGTTASTSGSVVLGGAASTQARAAAAGSATLTGTATSAAPVSGAGSVALGGAASAQVPAAVTGTIVLGGTATPGSIQPGSATGVIVIGGAPAATAGASSAGSISLSTAASAAGAAASSGSVTLGGTVTVPVPATTAGLVTLSGLAQVAASGSLRDITLTVGTPTARSLAGILAGRTTTATTAARTLTTTMEA